jgi:hypothetical protein
MVQISNDFASMDTENKSSSGNDPYCFHVQGKFYHLFSPLHPDKANNSEYGQFCNFDFTEATAKQHGNKATQCCMAEVMLRLDETVRQVNPLDESYKGTHNKK